MPWRALAKHHPRGTLLPEHRHSTVQVVYAVSGVMQVTTGSNHWTVPPQRALWVPAGEPHSIWMLSDTQLRTVYFQPSMLKGSLKADRRGRAHAISISALHRELLLRLFHNAGDNNVQTMVATLLLHTLCEAEPLPTELVLPQNAGLRRVAQQLIDRPRLNMSLTEAADLAGCSERTFSRRFAEQTGSPFRTWRQRARIVASLDLLSDGRPIKYIGSALGFSGAAGYVAAFRAVMGCSPGAFRENRDR
ncbi:AraC family transcriptional regulator [Caldimonas mangrovi]|nr:helix-turn-helix transcriptional regulator [Caldimonas mangrovi]